jgi:hypothetical protein
LKPIAALLRHSSQSKKLPYPEYACGFCRAHGSGPFGPEHVPALAPGASPGSGPWLRCLPPFPPSPLFAEYRRHGGCVLALAMPSLVPPPVALLYPAPAPAGHSCQTIVWGHILNLRSLEKCEFWGPYGPKICGKLILRLNLWQRAPYEKKGVREQP